MRIQNLVIWAWLSWIAIAQQLAKKWEDVLIIEKRNHIWWNCYDYYDENWILVHKYGPHIFHTDIEEVWDYVNQFSKFTAYQHEVLWFIDGNLVPIPFNLNSIYLSFPKEYAEELEKTLLKYFNYNSKVTIWELRQKSESENDKNLSFLADYIFEKVFKNYTMKQWWISADEIDPSVMNRVPVVISKDNRYFPHHKYQGMPIEWYTNMFNKMLDHEHIKVMLNCNYKDIIWEIEYDSLFVTSSIDEFFDYKYWKLWYRKTLYDIETLNIQSYQENTVINYPNDYEYTRITEFKKFYINSPTFDCNKTVICREIPWVWEIEAYPIWSDKDKEILEKYEQESKKLGNVYFGWRLANYKYLDMDKTIKNVLDFISERKK